MVKITSDSIADLEHLFSEKDIPVMPLSIILDGISYLDGDTIKPHDIFRAFNERKILPKTAARSNEDYKEFFNKHNTGDGIVHFCISQELSSSYNNALIASREFDNVFVIDSRTLSTGVGLLVMRACDMQKEGKTAEEIAANITSLIPHVQASFVVDTMEYLHKGGRCGGLARFIAAALQLKPTICLMEGKMSVGRKYMGSFSKNIVKYVEDTLKQFNTPDYRRIFITHSYSSPADVEMVKAKIRELAPDFKEIIETHAGCAITAHCGQNTLGILYINKPN